MAQLGALDIHVQSLANKFDVKKARRVLLRRPLVISASGSLDLEDLHGFGTPNWFQKEPAKAAAAPATTQFHWQGPSLSTERPLQGWPKRPIAFGQHKKSNIGISKFSGSRCNICKVLPPK